MLDSLDPVENENENVERDSEFLSEIEAFLNTCSSASEESNEEFFGKDYFAFLQDFSEKWLMVENNHNVSKTATDCFWRLAIDGVHSLFRLKNIQKVTRKVPQFSHLRRTLVAKSVPPIKMDFGYLNKDTGMLEEVTDVQHTPISQFPRSEYTKAYEIASIEVKKNHLFHTSFIQIL